VLWYGAWWTAIGLGGGSVFLSAVYPVPNRHFFPMFYAALDGDDLKSEPDVRVVFLGTIESVDRRHRITDRFHA